MKRFNSLLAAGFSAALIAGCGEKETTYEPIIVPEETIDMGENQVEIGESSYPGRSFKIRSELVGKITCGAASETQGDGGRERIELPDYSSRR
jgi:hypothetical protein